MKSELTVIIPFKNEGDEVYKTINSLNETSFYQNNIIIINDGSDDNYDYDAELTSDSFHYIKHNESYGVAASRDHGVSLCKTKYFIILDAHMRALTYHWDKILLTELKNNHRAIFCCLTKNFSTDKYDDKNELEKGGGVIWDYANLSYRWNVIDKSSDSSTCLVPGIMGASYATNVEYWQYIRGLEGLRSYGLDEQLLSMKTYMEGGECRVIKNICFSHRFRQSEEVPYTVDVVNYIYNQLYLIETLYPISYKREVFDLIKSKCNDDSFAEAITKLSEQRSKIKEIKEYYGKIFNRDFAYLIKNNKSTN